MTEKGWTNKETELVATYWLDTKDLYDVALDAYIKSNDPDVLPDTVKSYMYDLAYKPINFQKSGTTLKIELLLCALDRVNWREIADALIETFGRN